MNKLTNKKAGAYKMLNVIWGTMTLLFLLLALYFIWHGTQKEISQRIVKSTQHVSKSIDNLIDDLTQAVSAMNIFERDFSHCEDTMLPALQRMVLNHPKIAGLAILNEQKQILCSTLPRNNQNITILNDTRPLTLFTPEDFNGIDKPTFIIQQQLGSYYIEIYLFKSEVEKLLEPQTSLTKFIGLYDQQRKSVLLGITRGSSPEGAWYTSDPYQIKMSTEAIEDSTTEIFRNQLIRLNNVEVVVEPDNEQLTQLALRYVIIAGVVIILMSVGVYYYLRRAIQQHFSLHRSLIIGIKNNQFFPVYQPIIDRRTNQCCGAEVLLRWHATAHDTIMPNTFIEYAEQSGLIVPITLQLSEKAFKDCHALLRETPDFHISINLSSIHFTHASFLDTFTALCKKYNISHNQIMLEVTERDLLQNDLSLVTKMNELREAGFSIAVDDFGTGHASISYLQHFPFNYLKIDQLFVSAIGSGAVTEALNQSIIEMAKRLGLHVIAEGVETDEQLETLEENGAYLMQGWYFSKALSIDELKEFIKRSPE